MNELNPEEYFPDLYLKDLEIWIAHSNTPRNIELLKLRPSFGIGSICGFPSNHKVFESQAYKNFYNFAHFICVTYEMNVLNFALYAEKTLFQDWKRLSVPFLETHGYECTRDIRISSDELIRYFWFGTPPARLGLLPVKHYPFPSEFVPTPELLKSYDEFFVPRYAEEVLGEKLNQKADPEHSDIRRNNFGEKLLQSILRDPDCSTFLERNLEKLKLSEMERRELEELKTEGVPDPLAEIMRRKSRVIESV